jgi:hypothetical protein
MAKADSRYIDSQKLQRIIVKFGRVINHCNGLDIHMLGSLVEQFPEKTNVSEFCELKKAYVIYQQSYLSLFKKIQEYINMFTNFADAPIDQINNLVFRFEETLFPICEQIGIAISHLITSVSSGGHPAWDSIRNLFILKGKETMEALFREIEQLKKIVNRLQFSDAYAHIAEASRNQRDIEKHRAEQLLSKRKTEEAEERLKIHSARQEEQQYKRQKEQAQQREESKQAAWHRKQTETFKNYPMDIFLPAFMHQLKNLENADIQTENKQALAEAFQQFQEVLVTHNIVPIINTHLVPDFEGNRQVEEAILASYDSEENRLLEQLEAGHINEEQYERRLLHIESRRQRDLMQMTGGL